MSIIFPFCCYVFNVFHCLFTIWLFLDQSAWNFGLMSETKSQHRLHHDLFRCDQPLPSWQTPCSGLFWPKWHFLPVFWGLFNPPEGWFHCKMCLTNGHWPIDHGLHWWLAPLISRIYETRLAGSELKLGNSAAYQFDLQALEAPRGTKIF